MLERECDAILIALKERPSRRYTVYGWNTDIIHQQLGLPFDAIKDAVAQLRLDKVIDDNNGELSINDLGRILLLKGGYQEKVLQEVRDKKIAENQREQITIGLSISRQVRNWTIVLGIAAIIASVLAAIALSWDVWKFYHSCH